MLNYFKVPCDSKEKAKKIFSRFYGMLKELQESKEVNFKISDGSVDDGDAFAYILSAKCDHFFADFSYHPAFSGKYITFGVTEYDDENDALFYLSHEGLEFINMMYKVFYESVRYDDVECKSSEEAVEIFNKIMQKLKADSKYEKFEHEIGKKSGIHFYDITDKQKNFGIEMIYNEFDDVVGMGIMSGHFTENVVENAGCVECFNEISKILHELSK